MGSSLNCRNLYHQSIRLRSRSAATRGSAARTRQQWAETPPPALMAFAVRPRLNATAAQEKILGKMLILHTELAMGNARELHGA
jgi:hypothetical protein